MISARRATQANRRRDRSTNLRALLAIAALGVGLRVVYVMTAGRGLISEFGDAETYHLLGELLADGKGYIRPREFIFAGERIATAEFPPLWPMVLAVLDLVGFDSPTEQRLVGAFIGGVSVVVIGLLGEAIAGRRVGVVAAGFAAIYPQLIVLDGSLLSEGLYVLLVSSLMLGVVRALAGDADQYKWWLLASAALGLASITRTESLLLGPFLIVPAARIIDRDRWLRVAGVGLAGVIIILGTWTVRNAVSLGHLQPLPNNSGILLAGANCPAVYSGSQIGLWRLDCVTAIDTAGLDESARASAWRDAGINYARAHLDELPEVVVIGLMRTFGAWDIRTQLYFESLEGRDYDWLWAGWFMWVALAPLAAAGAVLRRCRGEPLGLLLAPIGVVVVTALTAYGNQRFRVLAEPAIIVLAAYAAVDLVGRVRRRVKAGHRSQVLRFDTSSLPSGRPYPGKGPFFEG